MSLSITEVLPGENADSIELSEDNQICQTYVIVIVTMYWERKMNENRRYY